MYSSLSKHKSSNKPVIQRGHIHLQGQETSNEDSSAQDKGSRGLAEQGTGSIVRLAGISDKGAAGGRAGCRASRGRRSLLEDVELTSGVRRHPEATSSVPSKAHGTEALAGALGDVLVADDIRQRGGAGGLSDRLAGLVVESEDRDTVAGR